MTNYRSTDCFFPGCPHFAFGCENYGNMVIMSMESYESQMKQIKMYEDIETSEAQIQDGKVKDARKSLSSMRERYGLSTHILQAPTITDAQRSSVRQRKSWDTKRQRNIRAWRKKLKRQSEKNILIRTDFVSARRRPVRLSRFTLGLVRI